MTLPGCPERLRVGSRFSLHFFLGGVVGASRENTSSKSRLDTAFRSFESSCGFQPFVESLDSTPCMMSFLASTPLRRSISS